MCQAIFFDLDGTLLPIDTRAFMTSYFRLLEEYFERAGVDPEDGREGIRVGTRAMFAYDGATTNEQRFWEAFAPFMDRAAERRGAAPLDWRAFMARFYAEEFPRLGRDVRPNPLAAEVVDEARRRGFRLALATNPLFPPEATAQRLSWTGVDASAFERVTAYQNSRYAKPAPEYYRELLDAMGLSGEEVLMVGNDPVEDFAACSQGCGLYLVTDQLIDRGGEGAGLEETPHGSMADLLAFVRAMPRAGA